MTADTQEDVHMKSDEEMNIGQRGPADHDSRR